MVHVQHVHVLDVRSHIQVYMYSYLLSRVSSVPSPTFMNTSSIVVTDTPKLLIPKEPRWAEG